MNYRKYKLCIGFAEFDDKEGPIISYIYPPDFPIDAETNFEIADYVLYVEGKTIVEMKKYLILSFQFKQFDKGYERKCRKYAIVVIISDDKLKRTVQGLFDEIEVLIDESIKELTLRRDIYSHLKETLRNKYNTLVSLLEKRISEKYKGFSTKSIKKIYTDEMADILVNNMIIVDLRLKLAISANREIIQSFIQDPNTFKLIKSEEAKILIFIPTVIYEHVLWLVPKLKSMINNLETKNKLVTSISSLVQESILNAKKEYMRGAGFEPAKASTTRS